MNNWLKITTIFVILITMGCAFYWFDYRSTKIKEKCSTEAHFDKRALLEFDDVKRREFINNYYNDCLMSFGLK